MKLAGSCHCKAVTFEMESKAPAPFMRCYCSVCRKLAGSGGYAIIAEHVIGWDAWRNLFDE